MKALLALITLLASAAYGDNVTLPNAERVVLENGTVLVLSENHDVPLIGLVATLRGGAASDPQQKYGLTSLLAGLLEKGAGDRDSAAFAEAIAAVGGELSASAGVESLTISAGFLAQDAELMIELVSDMLQKPSLTTAEFVKLRQRRINLIKAAKGSDPGELMSSYANAFLYGDHPYGNPVDGSESSLANISHGDLAAYYADMLGGDRLIISVSGDFETRTLRDALSAAFGDWRAAGKAPPKVIAPTAETGNRVYLIDKPGATQTYFYLGNIGVARGFSGRAALDLANTVFGGRFTSMLMTELRTKSGLSYGARSILSRYTQPGAIFISSFTETGTTVAALDVALGVLNQLRDEGLNEDMILSARNYVMGQFPPRLETASQIAGIFATLETFDLDVSYINEYGSDLAAATPVSVADVIGEVYPSADNLVFVVIGDAELIREPLAQYGPITEVSLAAPRYHP